jgi:sigma-B regulation protein RsbU (phosphoserine phosphatase)
MSESEHDSVPDEPVPDLSRTVLPNRVVAVVIALAFLPLALNALGFSFSAVSAPSSQSDEAARPLAEQVLLAQQLGRGQIIHVLMEWTAFMIALATAVFAINHYFVAHDVTTPTISTALFFSGMIDGFQSLAAVHLLPFVVDVENFLPFTWFASRMVNVCFLIAGTAPFVWYHRRWNARPRNRDLRFFVLAAVLFMLMAYVIVFLVCVWSPHLPQAVYPDARVVHRPWDMIPLFLYLFAGSLVFPRFYRAQPSIFSHSLFVSVIPNVAAQIYAAFGSTELFDNGFNIASFEKIVAYAVPLMGLLLDYRRAYYADVALQVTHEKLRVARNVQQGLLPKGPPQLAGFDIAGSYEAADVVGGDYYDYIPMADGRMGIVVADVSGHEIGASLLMAKTRAYLRALAKSDDDVQTILGRLHEFLVVDTQDKWFVTMFFAALHPQSSVLEFAGAAQQAHLIRQDGSVTVLRSTSTPLGVFADHPPRCSPSVTLLPGDLLVALTDGYVEAKSPAGEQFGNERMLSIVRDRRGRPASEILESLNQAVRSFCGLVAPSDDLTAVIVRRTA